MADERPLWRKLFDTAERAAAPHLEGLVKSEGFADVATLTMRVQAAANRGAERAMRRALHFWNLPAGSDIKRVSEQIASLERRVRELSKRLEELTEATHGQRSHSQRPRRSHPA